MVRRGSQDTKYTHVRICRNDLLLVSLFFFCFVFQRRARLLTSGIPQWSVARSCSGMPQWSESSKVTCLRNWSRGQTQVCQWDPSQGHSQMVYLGSRNQGHWSNSKNVGKTVLHAPKQNKILLTGKVQGKQTFSQERFQALTFRILICYGHLVHEAICKFYCSNIFDSFRVKPYKAKRK